MQSVDKFISSSGLGAAATRLLLNSVVFFGFYFLSVIGLHGSMKPIKETISLFHDLLPNDADRAVLRG
jgi:hypothetical protein